MLLQDGEVEGCIRAGRWCGSGGDGGGGLVVGVVGLGGMDLRLRLRMRLVRSGVSGLGGKVVGFGMAGDSRHFELGC